MKENNHRGKRKKYLFGGHKPDPEKSLTKERQDLRRLIAKGNDIASAMEQVAATSTNTNGVNNRLNQWKELRAAQLGMNAELWQLLSTPLVTDVLINGTECWVDRGNGCEAAAWSPTSAEQTRTLAIQMAAAAGKRLDDSSPIVDAFLGNMVRLHAVIPPLAQPSTTISLRVLRPHAFSLTDLCQSGTLTSTAVRILSALVSRRKSMLISGSTGCGKTTLLSALLELVPAHQRIICIEEVTELYPAHPHVIHLQQRQANIEGAGGIDLSELVRASMRMRPDRLILGECRGAEVRDVLMALNTGHSGGLATIHANGVEEIPARLVALGSLAEMSEQAVFSHAAAAFHIVLQLSRDQNGQRHLSQIGVLNDQDGLQCVPALSFGAAGSDTMFPGPGLPALERHLGWKVENLDSQISGKQHAG